jgi:hypothetical protein
MTARSACSYRNTIAVETKSSPAKILKDPKIGLDYCQYINVIACMRVWGATAPHTQLLDNCYKEYMIINNTFIKNSTTPVNDGNYKL